MEPTPPAVPAHAPEVDPAVRYAILAPRIQVIGLVAYEGEPEDRWCTECHGAGRVEYLVDVDSTRESVCPRCKVLEADCDGAYVVDQPYGGTCCDLCDETLTCAEAIEYRDERGVRCYAHAACLDAEVQQTIADALIDAGWVREITKIRDAWRSGECSPARAMALVSRVIDGDSLDLRTQNASVHTAETVRPV